jgi:hypothetical protein
LVVAAPVELHRLVMVVVAVAVRVAFFTTALKPLKHQMEAL